MSQSPVAIIGAGAVGAALAHNLVSAGVSVRFGVREGKDLSELLGKLGEKASSHENAEAVADAKIVFLAVPGNVAVDVARTLDLNGKILIDCNNPLTWDEGPVWAPPAEGSLTAAIAAAVPGARVVKAFNTFGAEWHADPAVGDTTADLYIAGDDAEAKALVTELGKTMGYDVVDAGPLRNAAVLENVAMLWIHLALAGGRGRGIVFKLLER